MILGWYRRIVFEAIFALLAKIVEILGFKQNNMK